MSKVSKNVIVNKGGNVAVRIVNCIPEMTKQGFDDGREAGKKFVHGVPYGAGAAVGFGFGATEAIVGFFAMPTKALFSRIARAMGRDNRASESAVQAESA
jgi:hypothetical protein